MSLGFIVKNALFLYTYIVDIYLLLVCVVVITMRFVAYRCTYIVIIANFSPEKCPHGNDTPNIPAKVENRHKSAG